jgi:hypothetical protein
MNIAKALLLHHLKDLEVTKETKMKKTKGNFHSMSIQLLLEKKVNLLFLLFNQRKMIYHKNSLSRHCITHLRKIQILEMTHSPLDNLSAARQTIF